MAATPDNPRRRRRTPVKATPAKALDAAPITEMRVPERADLAVPYKQAEVELAKVKNQGRRDQFDFLTTFTPTLLSGIALLTLLVLGAVFVFTDRLEAQTFMGYFASLIAGFGIGKGTANKRR